MFSVLWDPLTFAFVGYRYGDGGWSGAVTWSMDTGVYWRTAANFVCGGELALHYAIVTCRRSTVEVWSSGYRIRDAVVYHWLFSEWWATERVMLVILKYILVISSRAVTNWINKLVSYLRGGGVGERDRGKLATSRDIARDLMDPNACSGLRGAPKTDAIPL